MLAGVALSKSVQAAGVYDIAMRSDVDGAKVWFDPVGLWVPRGATIRWNLRGNVHTTTAYHPDNEEHSLRIPKAAQPWDSDYLVDPGDSFSVTLTVPGVYDYYCAPHEQGGMVGRIIVQEPIGPGAQPFDYFKQLQPAPDWVGVPERARAGFPSIKRIMIQGTVRKFA